MTFIVWRPAVAGLRGITHSLIGAVSSSLPRESTQVQDISDGAKGSVSKETRISEFVFDVSGPVRPELSHCRRDITNVAAPPLGGPVDGPALPVLDLDGLAAKGGVRVGGGNDDGSPVGAALGGA